MVTVEKTEPGSVTYRALGRSFVSGDQAEVPEEVAAWLCDDRGEFERVSSGGGEGVATCTAEKTDGEICGRERPCPYHDDQED